MTTTFITGYDGSDGARAALRFTRRLADGLGADVLAANVYPLVPAILGKGATAGALHELRDDAQADAERLLARTEVEHVAIAAPSPAEGLHALAEDQHAALVVVGGTHHGPVGRLVVGSVGEKLLHGSPSPVAVVPAGTPDAPVTSVGVAFDARAESRAALLAARDLAERLGARLTVIAVHEPAYLPYTGFGGVYPSADLERTLADDFAASVRDACGHVVGDDVEVRVVTGSAPRQIAALAGEGVDLLVTGSRGYGNVRGVLLGSTSRHLVDHAPCPVLVLPRGVTADAFAPAAATTIPA